MKYVIIDYCHEIGQNYTGSYLATKARNSDLLVSVYRSVWFLLGFFLRKRPEPFNVNERIPWIVNGSAYRYYRLEASATVAEYRSTALAQDCINPISRMQFGEKCRAWFGKERRRVPCGRLGVNCHTAIVRRYRIMRPIISLNARARCNVALNWSICYAVGRQTLRSYVRSMFGRRRCHHWMTVDMHNVRCSVSIAFLTQRMSKDKGRRSIGMTTEAVLFLQCSKCTWVERYIFQ